MPSKVKLLENQHGKPIAQILREAYQTWGNQKDVAKALGVNQSTVSYWLLKCGLEEKSILVEREVHSGR